MNTEITIEIKNVYGRQQVYPACPTSANLAKLAGTKTLTPDAMKIIRALGYEVTTQVQELVL